MLAEISQILCLMGRWDEALQHLAGIPEDDITEPPFCAAVGSFVEIHVARGEIARAREMLESVDRRGTWVDLPERMIRLLSQIRVHMAEGEHGQALTMAEQAFSTRDQLGMACPFAKAGFALAAEAAFSMGDMSKVGELLGVVTAILPGQRPPFVDVQIERFRARLAGARGDTNRMSAGMEQVARRFHGLRAPFWEAMSLLEHGELLSQDTDHARSMSLLASAETIFRELRADPYVKRAGRTPGGDGQ